MGTEQKLYELTEEHRAMLKPWADKWIANALSTEPMSDAEKAECVPTLHGLYQAADLKPPERTVFGRGPVSSALAAPMAEAAIYMRDQAAAAADEVKCKITAAGIDSALALACKQTVEAGLRRLWGHTGEPTGQARADQETLIAETTRVAFEAFGEAAPGRPRKPDARITQFMCECTKNWEGMRNGGNQLSGWVAYLSFFRHVAKLEIDYSKWQYYERLAEISGPRYMHEQFCVVSDRPVTIFKTDDHRPHHPTAPATEWRDGMRLYYWRGVAVPRMWIEDKRGMNAKRDVLEQRNAELRRCAAEIMGWDRVLDELEARVLDENANPEIGTLLQADLPGAAGERFLKVRCGTGRDFVIPVPKNMGTALQANNWTYGLDGTDESIADLEVRT